MGAHKIYTDEELKERRKLQQHNRYEKNKSEKLANQKAYYQENKKRCRKYSKRYYLAHKEEIRQNRLEHREEQKVKGKERYKKNRDIILNKLRNKRMLKESISGKKKQNPKSERKYQEKLTKIWRETGELLI